MAKQTNTTNNKPTLVILNMGGARRKDELREFLFNMFSDKYIVTNPLIRLFLKYIIIATRLEKVWERYKAIGKSPIYDHTEALISKLQKLLNMDIVYIMRYTKPRAKDVAEQLIKNDVKDVILLPLYPHYSTTTVLSSIEEFQECAKDSFESIKVIKPFYDNEIYNKAVVQTIIKNKLNFNEYNLIYCAHSLPKHIAKKEAYEKHIKKQIQILDEMFLEYDIGFKSITLAYQSKVGAIPWLEPSLEDEIKRFQKSKIILVPLSFALDNSESVLELGIEYKQIARELQIVDCRVCTCVNNSDLFCEFIKEEIQKIIAQ